MPTLIEVANSPAFLDPNSKPANSQIFLDMIPYASAFPVHPHWAEIEESANQELARGFYESIHTRQCSTPRASRANISSDRNLSQSRSKRLIPFLLPYLLGAFILVALPAGLSFFIAFQQYNGVSKPAFIGWGNFQFLFTEPLFKIALINSLTFTALAVPVRIFGALALELFYNRPRKGTGLYRAAIYLPTVIPDAAYALTWTRGISDDVPDAIGPCLDCWRRGGEAAFHFKQTSQKW